MYGNTNPDYNQSYDSSLYQPQQTQEVQQPQTNYPQQSKPKQEDKYYEPYNFTQSLGLPVNEFAIGVSDLDKDIPDNIVILMQKIAIALKDKGYVFRDSLSRENKLERAARDVSNVKDAYVISDKHAGNGYRKIITPNDMAYRAACYIYVNSRKNFDVQKFNDLKSISKRFKARDTQLLYGENLDAPVKFVFVYSKCGSSAFNKNTDYENLPWGTSEVLFANKVVPVNVINLGNQKSVESFFKELPLL